MTGTIWQKVVGPPELVIRENNWMVTVPEDTRFALKYLPPCQSKSLRAVWWGGIFLVVMCRSSYYDQHQTDLCTFKGAKTCFHGPIQTDTNFTRLLKSFISRRTKRRQQKAKNINTSSHTPFCVFPLSWNLIRGALCLQPLNDGPHFSFRWDFNVQWNKYPLAKSILTPLR